MYHCADTDNPCFPLICYPWIHLFWGWGWEEQEYHLPCCIHSLFLAIHGICTHPLYSIHGAIRSCHFESLCTLHEHQFQGTCTSLNASTTFRISSETFRMVPMNNIVLKWPEKAFCSHSEAICSISKLSTAILKLSMLFVDAMLVSYPSPNPTDAKGPKTVFLPIRYALRFQEPNPSE